MPQRFLSIKNFEKYQPATKRSYPWIKLYKSLLTDRDFLKLDINSRYLYVCLFILGSETSNCIPNDVSYLSHRCCIPVSQLDLKPLYRCGFLQASKTTLWRLDKREIEKEKREDIPLMSPLQKGGMSAKGKVAFPQELGVTEEEKVQWLRFGINAAVEFASFKDHALATDRRCKDWEAAKRNWFRKAVTMKEERYERMPKML